MDTSALTRVRDHDENENRRRLEKAICIHPPNSSRSQQALAGASAALSCVISS